MNHMKWEKAYNFQNTEPRIYKFWLKTGFFNPDKLSKISKKRKKPFVIMLPPPNVTGELHMGHALNTVCQDVLIRKKRMEGYKTLWLPGTDHAGIATQNVVEKELKKENLTRFDLGRKKFIERVWKWKEKYGNIILDQLKKLGASCDWSRTRFTMDKPYVKAVEKAFAYYYKKGWIYRGKKVINWCKRCGTSLSDLELEYEEKKGYLWYIKYPLKDSRQYIVVATTRPETMLGDTAVAVNPKDKRYKKFVGKKVILPLVEREIPIIEDELVDPKFGTGAVKVTPAHDLTDYEISLKHSLELLQVIDEEGKIINSPPPYQGLSVLEAREKIVNDLKKFNFLKEVKPHTLKIPKCYRCSTTIEFIPSNQWFLKMEELAKKAIKVVKEEKIKFVPKRWEKVYFDWLNNIRDWCISRQIWWGHRLPVWFCQKQKEKYFISFQKPKKCKICKSCSPSQAEDVLDTWFSSALWPFATLGWPKKTKDFKNFYPTDILSTARDIINFWVARMIFSSLELTGQIPFSLVFVHPTVLTKEGKRMSKSLGTGINPLDLVEKYGADAVRFGLAYQLTGIQDIRFGEENIVMGRKFCNKIWNASRYVVLQKEKLSKKPIHIKEIEKIPKTGQKLSKADKKIINALKTTVKKVNEDLENFSFGKSAHTLYHFFWHQFCDQYIEESKKQMNITTIKVLFYVLLTSLKLLHPFMPFITEEIYQKLPLKGKKKSLMIENWPK